MQSPRALNVCVNVLNTELQLGELVHNQKLFGLFEAMSAIEMMDPKMDAGMGCNKNPAGPLTFDAAVSVSRIDRQGRFACENLL